VAKLLLFVHLIDGFSAMGDAADRSDRSDRSDGICLELDPDRLPKIAAEDTSVGKGFDLNIDRDEGNVSVQELESLAELQASGSDGGFQLLPDDHPCDTGSGEEQPGFTLLQMSDEACQSSSSTWKPAVNVGGVVERVRRPVQDQLQVVLTNVFLSLQEIAAMAPERVRTLCEELRPMGTKRVRPWALQAASQLTRIAAGTIQNVVSRVRSNSWQPLEMGRRTKQQQQPKGEAKETAARDTQRILQYLVSEGLSHASAGQTDSDWLRSLTRAGLRGEDIGDKYHSREFLELVELLGCRAIKELDSSDLNQALPGLRIVLNY
jgi:hypothetical protein